MLNAYIYTASRRGMPQLCGIHVLLEHASTLGRIITELVCIFDGKIPSSSHNLFGHQGVVITHTMQSATQVTTGTRDDRSEAFNVQPTP